MNLEDAREMFENWYNACLENGVEPEEVVKRVGGMVLITKEEVIEKLENDGLI